MPLWSATPPRAGSSTSPQRHCAMCGLYSCRCTVSPEQQSNSTPNAPAIECVFTASGREACLAKGFTTLSSNQVDQIAPNALNRKLTTSQKLLLSKSRYIGSRGRQNGADRLGRDSSPGMHGRRSVSPSRWKVWCQCGKVNCDCPPSPELAPAVPTSIAAGSSSGEEKEPVAAVAERWLRDCAGEAESVLPDDSSSKVAPVFAAPSCVDVDRVTAIVADNLLCCICLGVPVDSVQLPCGHLFCRSMLGNALRRLSECPQCHHPHSSDDVEPVSQVVRNKISALQVTPFAIT